MRAFIVSVQTVCQHGGRTLLNFGVYENSAEAVASMVRTAIEQHGEEHPLSIVGTLALPIEEEVLRAAVEKIDAAR